MDFELINQKLSNKNTQSWTVEQATKELNNRIEVSSLLQQADQFIIVDENTAKQALSMSLQARKIRKRLDMSRKEIVRPHADFQAAINKIVKDYENKLNDIEENLSSKLDKWLFIRKETTDDYSPIEISKITVEDGSLSVKKEWAWEIVDIEKIPREFLCVDEKKIEDVIKKGIRSIEGICINEKEKISIRIKN